MNHSKFPARRASCVAIALGTLLFPMLQDAAAQRGGRGGGGGGAHTNVNRNVQANRNVNVNRNINVDVDRHDNYHPIATAAAVTATVAVTRAVVGSMVYSLPPSCSSVVINGYAYQQCGGSWYQPQYAGSQVTYVVVNPPQ